MTRPQTGEAGPPSEPSGPGSATGERAVGTLSTEPATEPARGQELGTGLAEWTWRLVRRIRLGTHKPANWLQLFKFGAVGASGYVVNLTAFALLSGPADLFYLVAAVGAFAAAVTNNFVWNRIWTFRATAGHAGFQAASFLIVSVGALGINLLVLALLVDLAGAAALPAQAVAVAVAMPCNFIGNKLWTFA